MGDLKANLMSVGKNAANSAIGMGLGMLTAGWQDRRQLEQNKKLQKQQIAGQKEMGEFNRLQAMKMWEDTNYAAQVEQMKKAGLSTGLMYGGSGAGGQLSGAGAGGGISGSAAAGSQDLGMGLVAMNAAKDLELKEAQRKNLEKDIDVKDANIDKTTQEREQLRLANWLQGVFQHDELYTVNDKDGKPIDMAEAWERLEKGEDINPALKDKYLEMLNKEANKDLVLSRDEEQKLKNAARELGVNDMDDMYLRMGARYAIEEGLDKNDARFGLVAASAAVNLFEMFSKFGMAKSLQKSGGGQKGIWKPKYSGKN